VAFCRTLKRSTAAARVRPLLARVRSLNNVTLGLRGNSSYAALHPLQEFVQKLRTLSGAAVAKSLLCHLRQSNYFGALRL